MTEKYLFADVNLPFHVWVREGCRWVLRNAAEKTVQTQSAAGAALGASLTVPATKPSAA
jgi:hypothetical protein